MCLSTPPCIEYKSSYIICKVTKWLKGCSNANVLMSQLPLELPNVLLCNVCITHSLNQHIPCGGLGAFATTPSGQPVLHYFFIIQGMGTDASIYCALVKPQSFKDCLCFACSFSAYMYSKEHEMVCVTCRERER